MSRLAEVGAHHKDKAESLGQVFHNWSHGQGPHECQSRHRPVPHRHALQGLKETQLLLMIAGTCSALCNSDHSAVANMSTVGEHSIQRSTLANCRNQLLSGPQT